MVKTEKNYAFIDSQNLHLGIKSLGWIIFGRNWSLKMKKHRKRTGPFKVLFLVDS